MKISLKQGKLTTSIHYKSTDSHSYLDYAHFTTPVPNTASRSPSFLDLAVCAQTMEISKKKLRKWPTSFFKDDSQKIRSKKLSTKSDPFPDKKTLQPNSKTPAKERPIMSLLYHPLTIRVRKVILSNWSLLLARTEVAKIFSRPPLIAYKRDTNIRDMLVRSNLGQPATRTPGTTPCNQEKCKMCPFIFTNVCIQ